MCHFSLDVLLLAVFLFEYIFHLCVFFLEFCENYQLSEIIFIVVLLVGLGGILRREGILCFCCWRERGGGGALGVDADCVRLSTLPSGFIFLHFK